jgi:hypothetical protein
VIGAVRNAENGFSHAGLLRPPKGLDGALIGSYIGIGSNDLPVTPDAPPVAKTEEKAPDAVVEAPKPATTTTTVTVATNNGNGRNIFRGRLFSRR